MKFYYVTYETSDGEHEYRRRRCVRGGYYKLALKKSTKAKRLFDRYGWEEFRAHDEIREISQIECGVLNDLYRI